MALATVNGEFGVCKPPLFGFGTSGKAYMNIRCVTKDSVRDANGVWADGPPCYIDVVCFGKQAENLCESIDVGDTIILSGRMKANNWTGKDGQLHQGFQIVADTIGVSVRWTPAKTAKMLEGGDPARIRNDVEAAMTAPSSTFDEPPF